jgi:cell division septal protein FtsQ
MRKRFSPIAGFLWVLVSLTLGVGVAFAVRAAPGAAPFILERVEVVGAKRTQPADLKKAAGLEEGGGLFSVDVEAVRAAAERLPWVRSVRVVRKLPNTLRLELAEWEPKYLIRLDRLYYLTGEGQVVKAALDQGLDYPVLTGVTWADLEGRGDVRTSLLELLQQLERNLDASNLSEIHLDPVAGFTVYEASNPGQGVYVGFGNLSEKLARLARLRRSLARSGQTARFVNLEYQDKVIARLLPAAGKGPTP